MENGRSTAQVASDGICAVVTSESGTAVTPSATMFDAAVADVAAHDLLRRLQDQELLGPRDACDRLN